ncbi:MAG: apolipoprotein N-acyltransferase [Acidimicrobiaceae bacterium]|nr:apolipoprotein N-acyltransferase [Acidimicrobiaceae bacterium]
MRRALPIFGPGLAAGILLAFSLPPWGFWPLGPVGFAVLAWRLGGLSARRRLLAGIAAGTGQFAIGIFWITEFQQVGFVALLILETSFVALAALITPPGRARLFVLPAALALAEAARGRWPFGGLPLGGVALGQAGGPLAPTVRIGGPLLLLAVTVVAGVGLCELVAHRRLLVPAIATVITVVLALLGAADTAGRATGTLRVASVQGGGVRGLRAVTSDPQAVYLRHADATGRVQPPVDLVLWPEDVVDLDGPLAGAPEEVEIGLLAKALGTTLVAGVVEAAGPDHFRNASVAWGPDGRVVDRYEKVHRVPFGEYLPLRGLISHLAGTDLIPRDAIPGHGSGQIRTPSGPFGVVISYEVFFADRARSGIRAGGEVLLVPTNAASFRTSQVPTQEVAAARLRALETGRDVIQAAPTGYGAVIDSRGRVLARTHLGRQQVLQTVVHRRQGRTWYLRWGDGPVVTLALVLVAAGWIADRRRRTPLDRTV